MRPLGHGRAIDAQLEGDGERILTPRVGEDLAAVSREVERVV